LIVPYFDPVPIEVPYSFGLVRGFGLAGMFGLAKRKTIGVGTLIVLLPFLPLPNGPKIEHFSHPSPSMVTGYVSARRSRELETSLPNVPTRWRKGAFTANSTRLRLLLCG
jgi:hypothetical protein